MGWSWAAACGVQGRGISWRPPAYSLLLLLLSSHKLSKININDEDDDGGDDAVRGARQLSAATDVAVVRRSARIPTSSRRQPDDARPRRLHLLSVPIPALHHPALLQLGLPLHATSLHQVSLPRFVLPELRLCVTFRLSCAVVTICEVVVRRARLGGGLNDDSTSILLLFDSRSTPIRLQ